MSRCPPLLRAGTYLAAAAWLGACAHAPPRRTMPTVIGPTGTVLPANPPDVSRIPDAVPRPEPRSAFGNPPFYDVAGHRYAVLASASGYVERGVASWYGTEFHGLRTATGEPYDMFAMTAAHKTLPLPCYARVTDLENGRSVVVRINDRGPFVANRIIDLSYAAAAKLDMIRAGTAFVQVEALTPSTPALPAELPVNLSAAAAASVGVSSVPAVSVAPAAEATAVPAMPSSETPTPAASPPATPVPALPTRPLFIQVGAFAQAENAERAARTLRAAGIDRVFTLQPDGRTPLQRVRVGPIGSVQEYDELIARLARLGFAEARLAQD